MPVINCDEKTISSRNVKFYVWSITSSVEDGKTCFSFPALPSNYLSSLACMSKDTLHMITMVASKLKVPSNMFVGQASISKGFKPSGLIKH